MLFSFSDRSVDLRRRVRQFMNDRILPNEAVFDQQIASAPSRWTPPPILEALKAEARSAGLWNL